MRKPLVALMLIAATGLWPSIEQSDFAVAASPLEATASAKSDRLAMPHIDSDTVADEMTVEVRLEDVSILRRHRASGPQPILSLPGFVTSSATGANL